MESQFAAIRRFLPYLTDVGAAMQRDCLVASAPRNDALLRSRAGTRREVLDATDAVIGANGVDRSRGGTIDTTVLIRPQSFCFKKARRYDPIVRRAGCRERQTDNFRRILDVKACDRWG
jgi:hypothetical protein